MVSFEEFVEVSSPRLVRTARMLLGSSSDAEDLAQETLIRMHRHWSRLREPNAAEGYGLKTLVRLTRRHLTRARFRREEPLSDQFDVHQPESSTSEDAPAVMNALAALPLRQRETIVLRYFLDLTVEDTARVMRCSAGTVKSQTSDALNAMRSQLAEPGVNPALGKGSYGNT